jgi:hypothetical protein
MRGRKNQIPAQLLIKLLEEKYHSYEPFCYWTMSSYHCGELALLFR